jgi:hypothetical protein
VSKEWIVALTLCAVIFHVVLAGRAFARASAGLVLEQSGSINPAMAPYSEIPAAATITLSTGAKIVFLYYRSCMQVTVLGGQIQFRPNGYSVINGIQSHERVPCPRALDVKVAGEVSGINLRGADQNPTISPTPSFVLVGKRSFDFLMGQFFKLIIQAAGVHVEAKKSRSYHTPISRIFFSLTQLSKLG